MDETKIPDWVTETPETTYALAISIGCNLVPEHSVLLTRDEFINLKRHLAAMRGYLAADAVRRWWGSDGHEQNEEEAELFHPDQADHVHAARAIYYHCPELIVTPDEQMIAAIDHERGSCCVLDRGRTSPPAGHSAAPADR